jgi:PAS domain S-box-containing protein
VLAAILVQDQRRATEHALQENAERLARAVDAELERSFAALEALSRSQALGRGDLKSFYEEAHQVRDALGLWDNLLLLSPSADHLLNLMRPFGTVLPPVPQPEGTLTAARTHKPYVSGVLKGRVETDWLMYIAYPAVRDGKTIYVIGATMNYRYWSRWLSERAPANVVAGIADRNDILLARTQDGARFAGQQLPDYYRRYLAGDLGQVVRGEGLSEPDVVGASGLSRLSGWHVNLVTSGSVLDAPMRKTAWTVSLAVAGALAIAVLLALSRAAVLTRGIRGLQAALETLRDARRLPELKSPVTEIQAAMQAARATGEVLADRAEALERAQQAARLGLWRWDVASNEVEWSEGVFRLVGAEPWSLEPSFERWTHFIAEEDRERVLAEAREALSGHEIRQEFRIRRLDGQVIWVASVGTIDRDGHGAPVRVQGVNFDITARREAEEQLREADRRKDEFLATLAHELRNPLAPIRNALQFLSLKPPPDAAARAAQAMMERQVTHMVRLIDDLLDVSRITRGRLELKRERVELSRMVEQALETSRPHVTQKVTVSLPAEPVHLDADPVRLSQVLSNLVNNAAKYSATSGHIDISARVEAGAAVVTVKDDGIGIAAAQLPMLFRMFSQAEPARARSRGGLGIGLSLAKSLVELHGGSIEAHSDGPGRGSEFIVRLPLAARMVETA